MFQKVILLFLFASSISREKRLLGKKTPEIVKDTIYKINRNHEQIDTQQIVCGTKLDSTTRLVLIFFVRLSAAVQLFRITSVLHFAFTKNLERDHTP